MTTATQLWFSEGGTPFTGSEPFYFDTAPFAWVKDLEQNWTVIRDELELLLKEHASQLVPYANGSMMSRPNQWRTFGMMFWTLPGRSNRQRCPRTWALIRKIPNLCAASFNLLEPNTTIKPHHGDTNAIIRCHLGIRIPAPAPRCGFRVGSEVRSWEEGKMLMFCDAHEHTAWNNSSQQRYILVLDVMRPEFANRRIHVASRVLASIGVSIFYHRFDWMRRHFSGRFGRLSIFGVLRAAMLLPLLIAAR